MTMVMGTCISRLTSTFGIRFLSPASSISTDFYSSVTLAPENFDTISDIMEVGMMVVTVPIASLPAKTPPIDK